MNIEELFVNYTDGGNNYVLKADSKNRWCGFNKRTVDTLISKHGMKFNIILWGTKTETDFYCIPFSAIAHLFTTEHMTKGKLADDGLERWTAIIENDVFKCMQVHYFLLILKDFMANKKM